MKDVKKLVDQVAGDHARFTGARADAIKAEAEILAKVIDEVRPALPALMQPTSGGRALALAERNDGGRVLLLLPDESWADESYHGNADAETVRHLTPGAVLLAGWRVDDIVAGIVTALERQASSHKGKAIERTESRVARLRAVLELLREVKS